MALVQSRSVEDALINKYRLIERYEVKYRQDARMALEKSAVVSTGKDGLITIDVTDHNPAFAAELANAYVEELQKLLARLAVTEAQQRRVFFERQLISAKDGLAKAEQTLKVSGINSSTLKATPQAAVEGLARLKASITAQEIKIASMRGYLTPNAPEFRQAQTELGAMRNEMSIAEKEEPVNAGGSDYIAKFRDYKYHETLFDLFAKQYEIARVDESREGAVIQIVDIAIPPERKAGPKRLVIGLVAALITGFLILVVSYVRVGFENASRDRDASEKLKNLRRSWNRAIGRA